MAILDDVRRFSPRQVPQGLLVNGGLAIAGAIAGIYFLSDSPKLLGILLLHGWMYSSLLALTAIGLTLVFGLGRVVNFALGVFYALGAYAFVPWTGIFSTPLPGGLYWPLLLLAPIFVAPVGLMLERVLIRPIRGRPEIYSLLLTFAIALVFAGIITTAWGFDARFPDAADPADGGIPILGRIFPQWRLVAGLVSMIGAVSILLMISRTTFGLRVRGATENGTMASMLGINNLQINTIIFGISAAAAALAGVLAGPMFTIRPNMGDDFLIDSFLAVVIGGLGSVRGAIAGAFMVGILSNVIPGWLNPIWGDAIIFGIVGGMLILRPSGIFGEGRVD